MTPIVSRSISLSWAVCLAALGPQRVCVLRSARRGRLLQCVGDTRKYAAREVREARAEFARQFEARDTGVDRENREAMRKIVHRERVACRFRSPYA